MEFFELLRSIEKSGVRYIVVGGIAVNLHGIVRPTKDIDLIVYLQKRNLTKFITLMTELGYKPRVPVHPLDFANPKKRSDWIKNKNMIVFSFYHEEDLMKVIDIFVKHPLPFSSMYKRRELIRVGDINIPVIGIDDLIKLKQQAGRLQDESDIRALKEVLRIRKGLRHEKTKNKKGRV